MFYLTRLSDTELHKGLLPWDYKPTTPIPDDIRASKTARDAWINRPTTEHHVYTFNEGVNPRQRISKTRPDGTGNPVLYCHALVADYDAKTPVGMVHQCIRDSNYPPTHFERTLSGNWRFVWMLQTPLGFPSHTFAVDFFKEFHKFAFDPSRLLPGFDAAAWCAPERLWTNGCDWTITNVAPFPSDLTEGWLVQASKKFNFGSTEFGPEIPLKEVAAGLREKYPKFASWPNEFEDGAMGPTFWIDESVSPKSATVRTTGMQTFSANAPKKFYSWSALLGEDFVRRYRAEQLGIAVEGIYHDGKDFWLESPGGLWVPMDEHCTARMLCVERKISRKVANDEPASPLDQALNFVVRNKRVGNVASYVFRRPGLFRDFDGMQCINTSSVRALPPADGAAPWGPSGPFPWLSDFLTHLLPEKQLEALLSWASWGYRHALKMEPVPGQILFLAGEVGAGKTLLNRMILGALFGGIVEAGPVLLGETSFNAELFKRGYWAVDDSEASTDTLSHRKWGAALKRVAANDRWRTNEKFRTAGMTEWVGRCGITCNADAESVSLIPDLNESIMDKLMLLRTRSEVHFPFPERSEIVKILERELPFLARFLLDYVIPEELRGKPRFGVAPFHDLSLVDSARSASVLSAFLDVLEDWRKSWFTANREDVWTGTAFQLHKQFMLDPSNTQVVKLTTVVVKKSLAKLLHQKCLFLEKADKETFKILRPGLDKWPEAV